MWTNLVQIGLKFVSYELAIDLNLQEFKSFQGFTEPLQALNFPFPFAVNLQPTVEIQCSTCSDFWC